MEKKSLLQQDTAYDKTDLEDEIRHWFTEAKRDDYIIAQIFQGLVESGWDDDLVEGYLQGIDYRQYVRVPGGTAPPQNPQNAATYSNEKDSDEEEVKSEQGTFQIRLIRKYVLQAEQHGESHLI